MPGFNIKIEGLTELAGELDKLKATARGHEVRAALLEGADLIRDQVRANAPIAPYATYYRGRYIAPGGLRRSLKSSPGRQFKNFLQAYAFSLKFVAPHAHLVEFGTKPHRILPAKGGFLKFGNRFKRFARAVNHPGAREQPFFRNAVRQTRNRVKTLLELHVKRAFDALGKAA